MNNTILDSVPESAAIVKRLMAIRNELLNNSVLGSYYPKGAIRFDKAAISTNLCPLVDEDLKTSTEPLELFIVGNDGAYLEIGDVKWKDSLVRWNSEKSAKIEYLLLSPGPRIKNKITEFKRSAKHPEKFIFYTIDTSSEKLTPSVHNLIDRWKTEHFVLGKGPKFLWLEANHPANTKEASDCAYLNPKVCEASPDWKICQNAVETVRPFLVEISN